MTRLTSEDLLSSLDNWAEYQNAVQEVFGCDIFTVLARAVNTDKNSLVQKFSRSRAGIIPISSGEGIIGGFSELLAEICRFLGCSAKILPADEKGFEEAEKEHFELILWADDDTFLAENKIHDFKAENGWATGLGYACALSILAERHAKEKKVLVLGAGPVGRAGAAYLSSQGFSVYLCDTDMAKARSHAQKLKNCHAVLPEDLAECAPFGAVLDATPADTEYAEGFLDENPCIAAPCVPCHWAGKKQYAKRLWHDPLQLGTAVMLASAVTLQGTNGREI